MIGIGEMYKVSHKISPYGIEGYQVQKKYELGNQALRERNNKESNIQEQKKKETKRGHYLEDYAKIHGNIPGPGVYNYANDAWTHVTKSSKKKIKPSKKMTYIDEIMQRQKKQNLPAPGQYKLFKDDKQIKADKKRLAHKKVGHSERFTYLDAVQYQATTTPGVGSYNPTFTRPRSATMLGNRRNSAVGIRPLSGFKTKREKQPDMNSYNPKDISQHKSFSKKTKGYNEWGRVDRFKSGKQGNLLGPGAYTYEGQQRLVGRRSVKSVYY